MKVRRLRVVFSRILCTYVRYSNLSKFERNYLILGESGLENEQRNSSEFFSGKGLARCSMIAPEKVCQYDESGALLHSVHQDRLPQPLICHFDRLSSLKGFLQFLLILNTLHYF